MRNEADLRALGAIEAYVRLRFLFGREITLNMLYGLDAAVSGFHWRAITEARKRRLRDAAAKASTSEGRPAAAGVGRRDAGQGRLR